MRGRPPAAPAVRPAAAEGLACVPSAGPLLCGRGQCGQLHRGLPRHGQRAAAEGTAGPGCSAGAGGPQVRWRLPRLFLPLRFTPVSSHHADEGSRAQGACLWGPPGPGFRSRRICVQVSGLCHLAGCLTWSSEGVLSQLQCPQPSKAESSASQDSCRALTGGWGGHSLASEGLPLSPISSVPPPASEDAPAPNQGDWFLQVMLPAPEMPRAG